MFFTKNKSFGAYTQILDTIWHFRWEIGQAQTRNSFTASYNTPEFTRSKYHHLEKAMNHPVKSSFRLLLGKGNTRKEVNVKAFITQVDPDSVYDKTHKVYSAALSGLRVDYVTYNLAD